MNSLSRSLYLVFSPRLPRFTREDVAGTVDYYNRLARHHEAVMDTQSAWTRRISLDLAVRTQRFQTAEKLLQKILRHVTTVFRNSLLENHRRIVLQK